MIYLKIKEIRVEAIKEKEKLRKLHLKLITMILIQIETQVHIEKKDKGQDSAKRVLT